VRGPKARALAVDLAIRSRSLQMPGDDSRPGSCGWRPISAGYPNVELALHVPVSGDAVSPFHGINRHGPAALRAADSLWCFQATRRQPPKKSCDDVREVAFSYISSARTPLMRSLLSSLR